MAEEIKNEEIKEENKPQQELESGNKASLVAFILVAVGVVVFSGWFIGAVAGIILGFIARKKLVEAQGANKNPFLIFNKITKIASLVLIIASFVMIGVWAIVLILDIIAVISAAANNAAQIALLF